MPPAKEILLSDWDLHRFWSKVDNSGAAHSCWQWIGCKDGHGYGAFTINGTNFGAHRISFFINGGITTIDKPWVLHSCHNRRCVNPAHLRAGSNQDNMDDMVAAGRKLQGDEHHARLHPETLARGEKHGNAKLTDNTVRSIRSRRRAGETPKELARKLNVSLSLIYRVASGKVWRHVA